MIKRLLTAIAAASITVAPALAKVDPGTADMLDTIDNHVLVQYNTKECDGSFYGYYDRKNNKMLLCFEGEPDAEDHDTVRHETWHVIQHCLTPANSMLEPVFDTPEKFHEHVLPYISTAELVEIMQAYPKRSHEVEIEAFVMANILTAEQVEDAFVEACL